MASTVSPTDELSLSLGTTVPAQRRTEPPSAPSGTSGGTPGQGPAARTEPGRRQAVAPVLVVIVAGLVFGWRAGRPGDWRDETATLAACRRSLGELFQLAGNLDLVHLGYYLLAKAAWQLDPSLTAVRAISVVAMSLAAGLLVLIGRRAGSQRSGVLAGLLLVVNPWASRYAQEARPFALAALLVTVLSWLLVVLVTTRTRSRTVALGYAVVVVLVGSCNVLALMIVGVHGCYLLTGGRVTRQRFGLWAAATVPALAFVLPFVVLTTTQRGQVAWIQRPHLYDLRALATDQFGSRTAPVVVLLAIGLLLGARWFVGRPLLPGPARNLVLLGAIWALVPPVLLFAGSWLVPLWDSHYLVFTLPGLSLLLAGMVPEVDAGTWVRWPAAVLPVALLFGLGLADQQRYRTPLGHDEDLAAVAELLGARTRPGDAVVFVPAELRVLNQAFPEQLRAPDDVTVVEAPIPSGTLTGVPLEPSTVLGSLLPHRRVWVVRGRYDANAVAPQLPEDRETLAVLDRYYRSTAAGTVTDIEISLAVRRPG